MNYQFSIKQNERSLKILKKIYKDRILEGTTGYIYLDNEPFKINNKILLIHNQKTLKLRRENNKKFVFLNLFDNFYQREFICCKFKNKYDLNFKVENKNNRYIYSLIDDYDNKILSIISKNYSTKKFIYLIMKFFNIE